MTFVERIINQFRGGANALIREMVGTDEVPVPNPRFCEKLAAARRTLRERGVKPKDRVVLVAPNCSDWIVADLAILAEGAVAVPLYARQSADELLAITEDAEPRLIIVDEPLATAFGARWPNEQIITLPQLATSSPAERADTEGPRPVVAREHDEPVTIIYTSGTSGQAKGVMLTVANCEHMLSVTTAGLGRLSAVERAVTERDSDRIFHYLPLCFAGSRVLLWTCLLRGNPIWLSTNLDDLKNELQGARPNFFLNVPFLLERIRRGVDSKIRERGRSVFRLYEAARVASLRIAKGEARAGDGLLVALARPLIFRKVRDQIGTDLECVLCGSAPLTEETQCWFEMLGIPVYQIYGLTETTAIVTMDEPRAARPGYVGSAIDGVSLRIADDGELLVHGPNVFPGYWRNSEATSEAFTEDGWFRTGDVAEQHEDGGIRVIGRSKNILVPSSGHNVAPEPLEQDLLERIDGAEHVVIFGHGRPFLTALITGTVDAKTADSAVERLNARLPHYRRIRKHWVSDSRLTPENGLLTANQKLKRRALEDHFSDDLARLYS